MADSQNRSVVGVHYRVGRKIGEGSFGVIFEGPSILAAESRHGSDFLVGTNTLNSQTVAIKFVCVIDTYPPSIPC